MRKHLDGIDPNKIRGIFKLIFSSAQKGKLLESYSFLEGYYLVVGDATQHFSSKTVSCNCCCEKNHRNKKTGEIESTTYHHDMLGAVIIHPDMKQVIPLCPAPITKKLELTMNIDLQTMFRLMKNTLTLCVAADLDGILKMRLYEIFNKILFYLGLGFFFQSDHLERSRSRYGVKMLLRFDRPSFE